MSEREYESRLQSLKPFITLFLVVIGSALLASCGGGGSATTDSSTAAQSSEVPNATIQAVSGSATVPGTWTGRAPSRATRPLSGVVTRQITSTSLIKSETTGQSFVSGEVLVNLKSSSDWDAFSIFLASRKWTVVYYSDSLNSYTIKTDAQGEASLLQYVKQMNSLPYTYGVSKNRVNIGPQSISADPSWGADDSSWNMYAIKLPAARDLSAAASSMTPGFGVGVGLVDGNFSRFHEDITFRSIAVYGGNTLVTSDIQRGVRGSKEASDDSNHGMHVAGIIAANENTTGLVGVAPGVTVDAANPYASNGYATDEAVKSIFSQDLRNSRVINLSLGWKMCETAICSITKAEADQEVEQFSKAFIEFAAKVIDNSPHAKSVLFIQSSGNNGDITWKNSNEIGRAHV